MFETRDQGTTNDAVYNKLQKTHDIIHPMNFVTESTPIEKLQINAKASDVPDMFSQYLIYKFLICNRLLDPCTAAV